MTLFHRSNQGGGPGRISPAELAERLNKDPNIVLVDVREAVEFRSGHIPQSLHIPLGTLPQRMDEIPKEGTVVTICRSGARSGRAAKMLASSGFAKVLNLEGGLLQWRGALNS